PQRNIEKWSGRLELGSVVCIFCNDANFHPTILDFETLTERIFTGPILRRHPFVNNRDRWRSFVVSTSELTAGNDRDPNRREIIFADFIVFGGCLLVRRGLVAVDLERCGR